MKTKLKMIVGSGNVFRDIGFDEAEAQNLLLRSNLMIDIEKHINRMKLTQTDGAKHAGITQARLNYLLKGRIEKFSLDALVNIAATLGYSVQ
jgi:predicted XRE-type DNA-binding protein